MPEMFYLFLVLAGAVVGFFSGLLGIGGGILMFPLLHYLPQAFGFDAIGVKNITGLTMVQGFFASISAMLFYQKQGLVNKSLVWTLGLSLFLSSLAGSLVSKAVSAAPPGGNDAPRDDSRIRQQGSGAVLSERAAKMLLGRLDANNAPVSL